MGGTGGGTTGGWGVRGRAGTAGGGCGGVRAALREEAEELSCPSGMMPIASQSPARKACASARWWSCYFNGCDGMCACGVFTHGVVEPNKQT